MGLFQLSRIAKLFGGHPSGYAKGLQRETFIRNSQIILKPSKLHLDSKIR